MQTNLFGEAISPDDALEVDVLFEPHYDPRKKRTRYRIILRSRTDRIFSGIVLKFSPTGSYSILYPDDLELSETTKVIIRRLVDRAIKTIVRKQDTGSIEDKFLLGQRVSEASWKAFLKQVNLD